jgi:hypothetical protein
MSSAITQVMTNAPVRPVRAVTSNVQRAAFQQVDRYEPSTAASRPLTASLTYGRSGQGGHADLDGDLA